MIDGLGSAGTTPLHRLPAGVKLAGLAVIATVLFVVREPMVLTAAAAMAIAVALSTGRGVAATARDLALPLGLVAAIGAIEWGLGDGEVAACVVPRLVALLFLAHAVTLTTSTAELAETFEAGLAPFERLGLIDAGRAALTLTLAIRFVPLIVEEAREIREAQAARGLTIRPTALIVPLVVRVLVRAEEVADAIDARGFPPKKNSNM